MFDSGLGGLTVLRAMLDLLPQESVVYFGDTGRFPYGSKPPEEVTKYALQIADLLVERGVKLLVVACNSATAAALAGAYQEAFAAADATVEVSCAACPGFVELVESGDVASEQVRVLAERLLAPLQGDHIDTLVLGCTHYPLLARTIGDVMGRDVVLVSSADETAFAVRDLFLRRSVAPAGARPASRLFVTSGDPDRFRTLGARFLGPEVETVEAWAWS
jgi:glutamate racemase